MFTYLHKGTAGAENVGKNQPRVENLMFTRETCAIPHWQTHTNWRRTITDMMALERGFYAVYMCGAVRSIFISHVYYIYICIYTYIHMYIYIYLLTLVSTLQYVKWWELSPGKNIMINHKHINICRTCKFLPYLCFLKQPQFPQLFPEHHRSSPAESHGHKEILIIESFSRWSKTPKSQ